MSADPVVDPPAEPAQVALPVSNINKDEHISTLQILTQPETSSSQVDDNITEKDTNSNSEPERKSADVSTDGVSCPQSEVVFLSEVPKQG